MEILDTFHELLYEVFSDIYLYRFVALISHVLVQADSRDILLYEINLFGTLKVVVDLAHIRVLELLHTAYLTVDCILFIRVIEFVLRINFNGDSLFCCFMLG